MKQKPEYMHLSTPPLTHKRPLLVSTLTIFCFLTLMFVHISHSLLRSPNYTRRFLHRASTDCATSRLFFSTNANTNTRMADRSPPVVVIIAGPTAAGKSDVAAQLCTQQKGMIVSADSVQAYRGVQIGANKPSLEERKETPHILIDVADHLENYNAAEWRDDAIYCIKNLLQQKIDEEEEVDVTTPAGSSSRRAQIKDYIQQSRIEKGYDEPDQRILPVICGGTMMYLQWLVHGKPDAMRPSEKAVEASFEIIQKFQENNNDYDGAVQHVASFGKVFAERAQNVSPFDWYRLRRTLEIALTVEEKKEENIDVEKLVKQLYSGERQGSLESLGFDVRCFFLCPDDRMSHTRVIDKRCEQMLMRGLLKETTELGLSGCMPEMAERAIGYRQTLDYLKQESQKDDEPEEDARAAEEKDFESYLSEFTTATRRYAVQQMKWFRKDKEFMFVPVSLKLDKSDRVAEAAKAINRFCELSREEYETELNGDDYVSAQTKRANVEQGNKMKFYLPERHILTLGSKEYEGILTEAIGYRSKFRSTNDKKRTREDSPTAASKK